MSDWDDPSEQDIQDALRRARLTIPLMVPEGVRVPAVDRQVLAWKVSRLQEERDEAVHRLGEDGTPAVLWRERAVIAEGEVERLRAELRSAREEIQRLENARWSGGSQS